MAILGNRVFTWWAQHMRKWTGQGMSGKRGHTEPTGKVAGAGRGVAAGRLICQEVLGQLVWYPPAPDKHALPVGHLRGQQARLGFAFLEVQGLRVVQMRGHWIKAHGGSVS